MGAAVTGQTDLFSPKRECVCCGRAATPLKRIKGEPNIMGVSMTIYRKGAGKGKLRNAHKVNICEECFIRARTGDGFFGMAKEAKLFLAGLMESLSDCYSSLVDDEWDGSQA